MNWNEFTREVRKRVADVPNAIIPIREGETREIHMDLQHAGEGMVTESAEFLDALKKYKFYGKPLDKVNLCEELGDLLFYVALALDCLGLEFEHVLDVNVEKLAARYGVSFSETAAKVRDLHNERSTLERVMRNAGEVVVTDFMPLDEEGQPRAVICAFCQNPSDNGIISPLGIYYCGIKCAVDAGAYGEHGWLLLDFHADIALPSAEDWSDDALRFIEQLTPGRETNGQGSADTVAD